MNPLVFGALALTTAGGAAFAGNESKEWLTLDRELDMLAAAAPLQGSSSATFSAFIRSSYNWSEDIQVGVAPDANDLGGFSLDNARLHLNGSIGDFSVLVQIEGSSSVQFDEGLIPILDPLQPPGGVVDAGAMLGAFRSTGSEADQFTVLDAYAEWGISDALILRMGNFRPAMLSSALVEENQLLFLARTLNGEQWDFRDLGAQVHGGFDRLGYSAAVQNGVTGTGDDLAFSGRLTLDLLGEVGRRMVEGAYGMEDARSLLLGVGYYADNGLDDADALAAEISLVMRHFSLSGEAVDYGVDDDDFQGTDIDLDNTPWSATASVLFDELELAGRLEDLDDVDDTIMLTVGVNWYAEGHNAKWQLNWRGIDSDNVALDADIIALGLVVTI